MLVVCSCSEGDHLCPSAATLRSCWFRQPPWSDDHPSRLAILLDLPADSLRRARIIDAAVAALDLSVLVASYRRRGSLPHRPDLLLKVILWQTQRGQHSPAQWARDTHENLVVRWLLRGDKPCRACWYAFRDRLLACLDALNQQLIAYALTCGLTAADTVVLDGTLLAAAASRHVRVNAPTLQRRLEQLHSVRSQDGKAAAPADAVPTVPTSPLADDEQTPVPAGADTPKPIPTVPGWMATTPQGRQQQQQRYEQARQRLDTLRSHNAQRRKEDRKPDEKVYVSLGDPQATLGWDKEGVYRPLYNVQWAVDLDSDLVLAYEVFSGVQDAATVPQMNARLTTLVGRKVGCWLADAGYATGPNLQWLENEQIELYAPWQSNDWSRTKQPPKQIPKSEFVWQADTQTYRCPQGQELQYVRTQRVQRGGREELVQAYRCAGEACSACPRQEQCTSNPHAGRMISRNAYEEPIERLRQRMASAGSKELYGRRKEQIERQIGDSKEHRKLRKLSGRGQGRARGQVGLTVMAHNIVVIDQGEEEARKAKSHHARIPLPTIP